jgi:uncharacterized membrane-anchored protein YhcB (DUF1043 family)
MIIAAICLVVGIAIGVAIMWILAGGKCQELQNQIDKKTNDRADYMRQTCANCYELRQLRKSNAALRGDNKRMYNIGPGNKGNSRMLYDLWAEKNTLMKGD